MTEWQQFLERGRKDLKISFELYEKNRDYELSAYLIQQALEKFVKAYLLKLGVIEKAEKLNHLPFIGIFELLNQNVVENKRKQKSPHLVMMFEHQKNMFDEIRKFFKEMKKPERKIEYWKFSLDLPNSLDINELMDLKLMSKSGSRLKGDSKKYQKDLDTESINKLERKGVMPDSFKKFLNEFDNKTESLQKLQVSGYEDTVSEAEQWLELLERLQAKNTVNQIGTKELRAILEIGRILPEIIKIFPHEDIGRYPIKTKDGTTTEIYSQRKEELMKLMVNIKSRCTELELKIIN